MKTVFFVFEVNGDPVDTENENDEKEAMAKDRGGPDAN